MPTTLRKACHSCIKAKRRCQPQLPKCERCFSKGLDCTYDLEPVTCLAQRRDDAQTLGVATPKSPPHFDSALDAQQAVIEMFKTKVPASENLPQLVDNGALGWVISQFQSLPGSVRQNQSSPFLHAQAIYLQEIQSTELRTKGTTMDIQCGLSEKGMSSEKRNVSIHDLLVQINIMIEQLISRVVNASPKPSQVEFENMFEPLSTLTSQLWSKLPVKGSNDLSVWHKWTTGESARRTLIAAYVIRALCSVVLTGSCTYEPYLESLPFDPRSGLWEANSEDAWLVAIAKHGGIEESLKSWNEFIEIAGSELPSDWEGDFQRLLYTIFHGSKAIKSSTGE